jgi:hypothetical protein
MLRVRAVCCSFLPLTWNPEWTPLQRCGSPSLRDSSSSYFSFIPSWPAARGLIGKSAGSKDRSTNPECAISLLDFEHQILTPGNSRSYVEYQVRVLGTPNTSSRRTRAYRWRSLSSREDFSSTLCCRLRWFKEVEDCLAEFIVNQRTLPCTRPLCRASAVTSLGLTNQAGQSSFAASGLLYVA